MTPLEACAKAIREEVYGLDPCTLLTESQAMAAARAGVAAAINALYESDGSVYLTANRRTTRDALRRAFGVGGGET